jgi:hypothetical protein
MITKCNCNNNKFILITEKMYEGCIDESKTLICEPEEQHIEVIKCSKCGKEYKEEDFVGIDY